jgi:hypothetical protein
MKSVQRLLTAGALALLLPLLAGADGPADAPAENRQWELNKLREYNPAQYAKLRHNLAVFLRLPTERQEGLRKLDRELHEEITGMRARLEHVMERYADWLERLPEADRQSVLSATDRKVRLQRIREIRDRQWLARLPRAQAEKLARVPEAKRAELIKKLRQDELDERLDWQVALRNPPPAPNRLDQLPEELREAVEKGLRPLLSRDEDKLLKEAEGKWPRFPRTLVELADNHPYSLLGPIGPTSFKDLKEVQPLALGFLKDKKFSDRLKEVEGKWPEYGVVLRDMSKAVPVFGKGRPIQLLPSKYAPSRPADFPPMVQHFIDKKLLPALDEDEAFVLKRTEGEWPNYPKMVLDLAQKHNLHVPTTQTRFEGRDWDRYRWRSLRGRD